MQGFKLQSAIAIEALTSKFSESSKLHCDCNCNCIGCICAQFSHNIKIFGYYEIATAI